HRFRLARYFYLRSGIMQTQDQKRCKKRSLTDYNMLKSHKLSRFPVELRYNMPQRPKLYNFHTQLRKRVFQMSIMACEGAPLICFCKSEPTRDTSKIIKYGIPISKTWCLVGRCNHPFRYYVSHKERERERER